VIEDVAEIFNKKILEFDETTLKPCVIEQGIVFYHVRENNLIFLVTSKMNNNALMVFSFIYKFIDILKEYFNGEVEEESVRDNFCIIYELLDEVMDNGYPQTTEVKILSKFITTKSNKIESTFK